MRLSSRFMRAAAALVAAAPLLTASPATAAPKKLVRVFDQVPRPPQALDYLENMGHAPPLWAAEAHIPYDALEKALNEQLKKAIPKKKKGKEECDDPCPDVSWSVTLKPKAKFTKKGELKLEGSGQGSHHGDVTLKASAQIRVEVHGKVHAETWANSDEVEFVAFAVIGINAKAKVFLWPTLSAAPQIQFTLDDTNLNLELNGVAVKLGAQLGFTAGTTPFGIMGGGPLALGSLGALLGNEAADMAEAAIQKYFKERVEKAFKEAMPPLENKIEKHITMQVQGLKELIDEHYRKPLPGLNKSVAELSDEFGAKIEVHTLSSASGFSASAVARFDGKPSTGKLVGKVRIPKQVMQCIVKDGLVLPLGYAPVNADLEPKVGTSCEAILGPDGANRLPGVRSQVYLGANPQTALGPQATARKSWKAGGAVKFTGKLRESRDGDAYECTVEISKLPKAAFVSLTPNGKLAERQKLGAKPASERLLAYPKGGKTAVLDRLWKPTPLVLDEAGSGCDGGGGAPVLTPSQVEQFLQLIDGCPECGLRRKPGKTDIVIVDDVGALRRDPVGKIVADKLKSAATR
jgi:hypothetical protein